MFCPNKNLKEWKELDKNYPDLSLYFWNRYEGNLPNFLTDPKVIQDILDSTPEISKIGNASQYAEYLSTVFPDSKVGDVVYHGSNVKFDKADLSKSKFNEGFYFAKDKAIAENYGNVLSLIINSKNTQIIPFAHFGYYTQTKENLIEELNKLEELKNRRDLENALALQLIDITTEIQFFNTKQEKEKYKESNSGWENVEIELINEKINETKKLIDSINKKGEFDTMLTHDDDYKLSLYAVGKSEQIHILGSKQDIEGFRNYLSGVPSGYTVSNSQAETVECRI